MVHGLSSVLKLYIVNEYPKSGGTWLGQMLSRSLDLPFPRNRLPVWGSCIMHGHYLNPWGMKNVVVPWRDGRDVMVSWYHHFFLRNELSTGVSTDVLRRKVPFEDHDDVKNNLPDFIEASFRRGLYPRFTWSDFVRQWYPRKDVVHVKYEDLWNDTGKELERIVFNLTRKRLERQKIEEIVEEFSFERQSGRKPGEERKNSFLRKGIVGDWRNYFSREACEAFDYFAGDELILLGYERNRSWIFANL